MSGNDATNDARLSQTADEAEGHADNGPWGAGMVRYFNGRLLKDGFPPARE